MLDRLPPRIVMTAPLVRRDVYPPLPCRPVAPGDLCALADLLVAAYRGTVDDLDESPGEALDYLEKRISGAMVGPMLWDCSFLALDDESPVAAVITSEEEPDRPLLGDVYTHPDWQRRGLATALIQLTANALLDHGYMRMTLRVAIANEGARRLYERIGFVRE